MSINWKDSFDFLVYISKTLTLHLQAYAYTYVVVWSSVPASHMAFDDSQSCQLL